MHDERRPSYEELAALVVDQARVIDEQAKTIEGLEARVAELERSSARTRATPASRRRAIGGGTPAPGRGADEEGRSRRRESAGGASSAGPRARRWRCRPRPTRSSNTARIVLRLRLVLDESADVGYKRRQVVEVPPVKPVVTEHRAHTCRCGCGSETTAAFPGEARAPVSYGPRAEPSWPTCSAASTSPTAAWPRRWATCSALRSPPALSTRSTPRPADACRLHRRPGGAAQDPAGAARR